jgi:hypothetical protein
MALLVGLAIGPIASAPGVKIFREEKFVFWREPAAGHNRFAYYLGKVIFTVPRMVLANFHFSTFFLLLATPRIAWQAAFTCNLLYFYCIYGLASVISMVTRREDGPLLAVISSLIIGVLSGMSPTLVKVRSWHMVWLWREEIELVKNAIWLANSANPRNIIFARTPQELSYWSLSQILSCPFQSSSFNFQSFGYERSLGTFCNQLETWNPANSTHFTTTSNLSVLDTNDLSHTPTSIGLATASNPKHAFYAYLHALIHKSISDFQQFPKSPRKRADTASWNWQLCTQFAQFQVSQYPSPHNLLSRFYNLTNQFDWYCHGMFPYAPEKPAVEEVLKYRGWKMRPSNVMFTNGELDPWRGLGVQSDRRINPEALERMSTTPVPKCGVPPDGDDVFGAVWEGAVHVRDLRTKIETFEGSLIEKGLELFGRALDGWLPCFDSRKSEPLLLGKE